MDRYRDTADRHRSADQLFEKTSSRGQRYLSDFKLHRMSHLYINLRGISIFALLNLVSNNHIFLFGTDLSIPVVHIKLFPRFSRKRRCLSIILEYLFFIPRFAVITILLAYTLSKSSIISAYVKVVF